MKKIIALLLLLCTVLGMAACDTGSQTDPSDTTAGSSDTDPVDRPIDYMAETSYTYQKLDSGIQISDEDGLTDYIILVPTSPSTPTVELEVATTLRDMLWDLYGVRIRIAGATKRPTNLPEILIGETCRESMGVIEVDRSGLGDEGYFVRNYEERIVFAANTDEALWNCMYDFMRSYLDYDAYTDTVAERRDTKSFYLPENVFIRHNGSGKEDVNVSINGKDLSDYLVISGLGCGTAASDMISGLEDITGATFNVIFADKSSTTQDLEIVIGQSTRDGVLFNIDYDTIGEKECAVYFLQNRLIFAAHTQVAYRYGVREFLREYLGYAYSEAYPTEDVELKFDEGLVKSYTVNSDIHQFTCGTVDYEKLFADNMNKMAGSGDICYSDETTLKKVLSRARTQAKYGDVNMSYVPDTVCNCQDCKKAAEQYGSPYGAYYAMMQKVAQTLLEEGIDASLLLTAFGDTYAAPSIAFPSNICVTVANRKLCSAHCVGDASCETNAAFAANLDAWLATGAQIDVVDFTCDFAYYPATFPNYTTAYQNIVYYAQKGVRNVYMHFNTVQASLEFGELRERLYTEVFYNTAMTEDEFRAEMLRIAKVIYGEEDGQLIYDYIQLMTEAAVDGCFSANDAVSDIIPIAFSVNEETGRKSYDLETAIRGYKLWNQIHPYYEALATSKVPINQYLFNQYQGTAESHAYNQFSEWLLANVDMCDYTIVLNQLFEAGKE